MPIQIASFLTPKTGSAYALMEDIYFKGGFRAVSNTTARDNIDTSCLKAGMVCYTTEDGKFWQYSGTTWLPFVTAAKRVTVQVTTANLANGTTDNIALNGFKGYAVLAIETSAAAWVRLYSDIASRTADASRLDTQDPLPGAGVLLDVMTTGAVLRQKITPAVVGFSDEGTPNESIPVAVTNKSGTTQTITLKVTLIQLEG